MTGAEKTLKWYKEFVKTNGVYPLIKEVESQLEMAVEEEQVNKNESISLVSDYRLLEDCEMIQRLDEYTLDGVNWKHVEEWDIGQEYEKHNYNPLRRKK